MFRNNIRFYAEELLQPRRTPSWRTTPCRLSATAYSIYSQLPSILETVPPPATWGRAMPWWQGPTYLLPILRRIATGLQGVTSQQTANSILSNDFERNLGYTRGRYSLLVANMKRWNSDVPAIPCSSAREMIVEMWRTADWHSNLAVQ